MHNYFCPQCGCALDPCERCDCQDAKPKTGKIVTCEDWGLAGNFDKAASPGDAVEVEIVEEFLNVVPPATNRAGLVQCGEPVSFEKDPRTGDHKPTYTTFRREDSQWYYCGNCFIGETTEPKNLAGATA